MASIPALAASALTTGKFLYKINQHLFQDANYIGIHRPLYPASMQNGSVLVRRGFQHPQSCPYIDLNQI